MRLRSFLIPVVCFLMGIAAGCAVGMQTVYDPCAAERASSDSRTINPLDEFLLSRRETRQLQISQLNDLIHSEGTDEDIRASAGEMLLDLLQWTEWETTIEGVLNMRQIGKAVVTIHEDSVNVMLQADMLTEQQTAIISELVCRETGISRGNVKIMVIN